MPKLFQKKTRVSKVIGSEKIIVVKTEKICLAYHPKITELTAAGFSEEEAISALMDLAKGMSGRILKSRHSKIINGMLRGD